MFFFSFQFVLIAWMMNYDSSSWIFTGIGGVVTVVSWVDTIALSCIDCFVLHVRVVQFAELQNERMKMNAQEIGYAGERGSSAIQKKGSTLQCQFMVLYRTQLHWMWEFEIWCCRPRFILQIHLFYILSCCLRLLNLALLSPAFFFFVLFGVDLDLDFVIVIWIMDLIFFGLNVLLILMLIFFIIKRWMSQLSIQFTKMMYHLNLKTIHIIWTF